MAPTAQSYIAHTMRVVVGDPPLIDAIDAVFKVRGKAILFAFGDTIYNPSGGYVPQHLHRHEAVHGVRQGNHVEEWWQRYLADREFRLAEEIPAHVAEFQALCEEHLPKVANRRNMRRLLATDVAKKLAAPLYGNLISLDRARRVILDAA